MKPSPIKLNKELIRMRIKSREVCVLNLDGKLFKQYFVKKCQSGIMSIKKTAKLFISNKTNRNESDIILIESNIIKDRKNVADNLNEYFINIAEYAAGRQVSTFSLP